MTAPDVMWSFKMAANGLNCARNSMPSVFLHQSVSKTLHCESGINTLPTALGSDHKDCDTSIIGGQRGITTKVSDHQIQVTIT